MCYDCWLEYGQPSLKTPLVEKAVPLIYDVYWHHLAGGGLHIVLDDWNLEDEHLAFCEEWMKENETDTPEQRAAELACLEVLKQMTVDERASALAWFEEFLPEGSE